MKEVVKLIPPSLRETVSNELIKVITSSPHGRRIPSSIARSLLYYWQRDQLSTEIGLAKLIEASLILEQDRTIKILIDLGLDEAVRAIKEIIRLS